MSKREGETMYRKQEKAAAKPRGRPRKAKSVEPPTTKMGETSSSSPQPTQSELKGEVRKKWVTFIKDVKQYMKEQGQTDDEIKVLLNFIINR